MGGNRRKGSQTKSPSTLITPEERRKLDAQSQKLYERLRHKYLEVHGRVVDFISHSVEDGTPYFTVRFTDKTDFCLRYTCKIVLVGADISDFQTGDFKLVREYMKPIST